MDNYFGGGGGAAEGANGDAAPAAAAGEGQDTNAPPVATDDIDMIE